MAKYCTSYMVLFKCDPYLANVLPTLREISWDPLSFLNFYRYFGGFTKMVGVFKYLQISSRIYRIYTGIYNIPNYMVRLVQTWSKYFRCFRGGYGHRPRSHRQCVNKTHFFGLGDLKRIFPPKYQNRILLLWLYFHSSFVKIK